MWLKAALEYTETVTLRLGKAFHICEQRLWGGDDRRGGRIRGEVGAYPSGGQVKEAGPSIVPARSDLHDRRVGWQGTSA